MGQPLRRKRIEPAGSLRDVRLKILQKGLVARRFHICEHLRIPRRSENKDFDARRAFKTPYAWTRDSKAVIFRSDRKGTYSLYKQALDQSEPELIPTGPESTGIARVSPDGNWLVYTAFPNVKSPSQSNFTRLMRVPMTGGAPQSILETKATDIYFDCTHHPGALCVVEEVDHDAKQAAFTSLDPLDGTRHQLFRIALPEDKPHNWTVSPDGSHIAMTETNPRGAIKVRSLAIRGPASERNAWMIENSEAPSLRTGPNG